MNEPDAMSAEPLSAGRIRVGRRSVMTALGILPLAPALRRLALTQPMGSPKSSNTLQVLRDLAISGTTQTLTPPASLPVLLDVNRANLFQVTLPLAALGGVPSVTVLPVSGAPIAGQTFSRVVQFQQPFSGSPINPHLSGITGSQPRWGSGGPGSTDEIMVVSTNGKAWSIGSSSSSVRSAPHSLLETVTSAPVGSVNPMSLPMPILLWSAADMYASTSDGTTFPSGSRVGTDFSGSGNVLVVNAGETITYHRTPLAGTGAVPSALPGFPYISATAARQGLGVSFAGGPITAWTILVSLSPGDRASGGTFVEEAVFKARTLSGQTSVKLSLKYGNMAYTWDGSVFNNVYWSKRVFTDANGAPSPTVIGWSATGESSPTLPAVVAGSLAAPLATATSATSHTASPPAIAGIDLPNAYGICGLAVFATALDPSQMRAAALRLGYAGFGERL